MLIALLGHSPTQVSQPVHFSRLTSAGIWYPFKSNHESHWETRNYSACPRKYNRKLGKSRQTRSSGQINYSYVPSTVLVPLGDRRFGANHPLAGPDGRSGNTRAGRNSLPICRGSAPIGMSAYAGVDTASGLSTVRGVPQELVWGLVTAGSWRRSSRVAATRPCCEPVRPHHSGPPSPGRCRSRFRHSWPEGKPP